ncbi:MAG: hypothetical protein KDA44_13085 [Planctomycetales bacterium]|nr:hypothetical protein [Planctomycetales bacterium]
MLVLLAGRVGAEESAWPPITQQTKPWTRWWWHGSAVDAANITKQLEAYAAAGLGGVEITPIFGVRGTEDQFLEYLSPEWMDALEHTLVEAERLGLGVDMATGNGWPFGGPWVEADTACRNLVLEKYELAGGERLQQPVLYVQPPLARAIGRRVSIEELKEPIRNNDDLQALALEQVRFPKPLPLAALVAVSQDGTRVQLADKVADDGTLDWTAPAGQWTLYAAFSGWHGKMVERAGPGGEGNVIDHFSAAALKSYLDRFDEAFAGRDIESLRGFFNDSYEVDDAAGESDWTPEFFAEFQRRRGYDLRDELPTLTDRDDPERLGRVLCDYRETVSDLLLDDFTRPWDEWARGHGAITRNQSHGSPGNLLDLYAASGIPETEGEDRIKFMTAASAAHVTGKQLASAEAATWMDEHFLGTLAETKRWCDNYFLGGVNHICYHGTPYTPEGDPWPGWLFYASVHYGTTNSFWPHFHALNEYVARCQSFLQAGRPDNDVLVYYPIHDQWSKPGRARLVHFDGSMQGNAARKCAQWLLDGGYLFDFISDRQLAAVEVDGKSLKVGGNSYRAIVAPECRLMPAATLATLAALAENGATVVFETNLPEGPPGLGDRANQEAQFQAALARFEPKDGLRKKRLLVPQQVGKGRIVLGQVNAALAAAGIERESLGDFGLAFVRRKLPQGTVYFIRNNRDQPFDGVAPLRARGGLSVILDPLSGEHELARRGRLQLGPGQTRIVLMTRDIDREQLRALLAQQRYTWRPTGEPQELTGPWSLEFVAGGPNTPAPATLESLQSWTKLPDEQSASFSGTVRYTKVFDRPRGGIAWSLDLGEVRESAAVTLNGKPLATLFAPPYQVVIDASELKAQDNILEIEVANLMANRIAAMERAGDASYKKFYNINFPSKGPPRRGEPNPNMGPDRLFTAKNWEPRPSGLLGPVTIAPVQRMPPSRDNDNK